MPPTPSARRARGLTAAERALAELPDADRDAGDRPRRRRLAPGRGRDRRLAPGRAPLAPGRRDRARRGRRPRAPGRSMRFDLVAGLAANAPSTSGALAAAPPLLSLEIDAAGSTRSARPSAPHRGAPPHPRQLVRRERIDAVVGVGREGINIELAEQLEQLGSVRKREPRAAPARPLGAPRGGAPARPVRESRPVPASQRRRAGSESLGVGSSLSRLGTPRPDLAVRRRSTAGTAPSSPCCARRAALAARGGPGVRAVLPPHPRRRRSGGIASLLSSRRRSRSGAPAAAS